MRTYNKIFLILFLVIISSVSYSQVDKNGGSVYSIFGLGDLNYSVSTRTDGMGILGIGLSGSYVNSLNPADWTALRSTLFSTKFNLKQYRSKDDQTTSVRTGGTFDGFDLAIPANANNGWIIDLGLHQYSQVNYDIKLERSSGDDKFTQYYSGNGGLSKIDFGTSYNITKNIGFGLQFNYVFGNIERSIKIDFANNALYDTDNELSNSLSGFYFTGGLLFKNLGKVFKSKGLNNLNIGLMFSSPMKLSSKVTGKFITSAATDSITVAEGDVKVPWRAGLGISNMFGKGLIIAADAFYQKWDDYKYYDSHPDEIKNSLYLGLGMEYLPSVQASDSYFKRVAYRLGAAYIMDYIKVNSEDINSLKLSAGLRLPIGRFNSIDLLFSYTRRGKESNGLILDNIFNGGISFNIGELWFIRPEEE